MNRDVLYRSVLRGLQESPQLGRHDLSPMTSLANTLLESSLNSTPRKRLSLSSTLSDTPKSTKNSSSLSVTNDSTNYDAAALSSSEKSPLSSNSILSSPRNKENLPTPYYSPSHSQIARHHQSPLREVQNTATRNLSFSPLKKPVSPSRREHLSPIKKTTSPDDCDSNSRDSGYSESGQKRDGFNVPRSCAPTRRLNLDMSPKFSPFKSPSEGRKVRSFASLKKSSEEDEFLMEFICAKDIHVEEDEPSSSLSSLFSAPVQSRQSASLGPPPNTPRLPIRRCLSMVDTSTPLSSRIKVTKPEIKKSSEPDGDRASSTSVVSFKRPKSPSESSTVIEAKRRRAEDPDPSPVGNLSNNSKNVVKNAVSPKLPLSKRKLSEPDPVPKEVSRPKIQRCHSESHVSIMKALNISSSHNGDLTGDFTQSLSLPVISGGKHPDLKSISIHTMAALIHGEYSDKVASFKVLDCRYPYEYSGGHITNALNWHHPKMVQDYLNAQEGPPKISSVNSPHHILIFHCEFSAERGPRAQRMLREIDRTINKEHYPALHFPELYLLEGGYKSFYETYSEFCKPTDYIKMLDENHSEDLKFFRSKSKSWTAENKQSRCPVVRTGPKRLGL